VAAGYPGGLYSGAVLPRLLSPAHSGQVRHPVCRNGHYTAKADGSNWSPGSIVAESDERRPLRGYRCEASSMWDATKLQGTVKLQPGVSEGGDRAGGTEATCYEKPHPARTETHERLPGRGNAEGS
jgi:hypothetical protein